MTLHFPKITELTNFTFTWNFLTKLTTGKLQEYNIRDGGFS